jgi:ribosome-dependent ATPase
MVAIAYFLFGVAVKGSWLALASGALLYVAATTAFGLVISSFTRTQVAAIFATAIIAMVPSVNFSGFMTPVASLSVEARLFGLGFPASWFQQISIGSFTKALGFVDLWPNHLALALFAVIFIAAAQFALPKQEA